MAHQILRDDRQNKSALSALKLGIVENTPQTIVQVCAPLPMCHKSPYRCCCKSGERILPFKRRNAHGSLGMSHPSGAPFRNALRAKAPQSASNGSLQHHIAASPLYTEPDVITPPENFALVEPALFRSSLPNTNNFPFIRTLQLKHVIILSAERPVRSLTKLFDNHNIQVSHTGLHAWTPESSWKPISEEVVKESMEIILRRENHPMLVCDVGGMHLVGMVIGCLRRLQNWNLNSVVNEYRSFAGAKTRYVNEQFIELFDIDLVTIPEHPPPWFVEQMELDRRETDEYARLIREGRVDTSGTLEDANKAPRYVVYYFSSASPLNSQVGGPEGDGLLTNAEVRAWLKEKNFEIARRDVPKEVIKPCGAVASLSRDIREYLESSPSGLQKVRSTRALFAALQKFKLSAPEMLMIANVRPDAYAHLTPLIADAHSRFDEDQIYEILEVINATLEKRKKEGDVEEEDETPEPAVDFGNLEQADLVAEEDIMPNAPLETALYPPTDAPSQLDVPQELNDNVPKFTAEPPPPEPPVPEPMSIPITQELNVATGPENLATAAEIPEGTKSLPATCQELPEAPSGVADASTEEPAIVAKTEPVVPTMNSAAGSANVATIATEAVEEPKVSLATGPEVTKALKVEAGSSTDAPATVAKTEPAKSGSASLETPLYEESEDESVSLRDSDDD